MPEEKICERDHGELMSYICETCNYNDIYNDALADIRAKLAQYRKDNYNGEQKLL